MRLGADLLVVAVLAAAAVASLFVRRHGEARRPRADWRPTAEVFRDPSTGRLMRVWVDAAQGRHYVAERGPRG